MAENESTVATTSSVSADTARILGGLSSAIEAYVAEVGQEAMRLAFALSVRQQPGPALDADTDFHPNAKARGEIARRAVSQAVGLLRPAIGEDAALFLAGSVLRLGDGSVKRAPTRANTRGANILLDGARKHVQADYMHRRQAVLKVSVASRVLREWMQAPNGSPEKNSALKALKQLGIANSAARSRVRIELALLEASIGNGDGYNDAEDRWERARQEFKPAAIAELATRMLTGTLTDNDRAQLLEDTNFRTAIERLASNSNPSNLPQLTEQVSFHWRQ